MIGIIDYGSGNIQAIRNIYKRLKIRTFIIREPQEVALATKLILPGVGAFDEAIGKLDESGLRGALDNAVLQNKVPVMGICVGMQIMADSSEEGTLKGLGWISGSVKRFDINQINIVPKLPHMGWNEVNFSKSILYKGIKKFSSFYFVHSYYLKPKNNNIISGTCVHGDKITSSVEKDNIFATQFHPEKSHDVGLKLLKNFINN